MHVVTQLLDQALSSLIRFGGHVVFDSNRHHPSGYSGVIYLSAFGQIMLEKLVDIHFTNNTGRYITVEKKEFPITIII